MSPSKRARPELPPLAPEAARELKDQVARVDAALAAGRDLPEAQGMAAPRADDALWDQHLLAELGNLSHPALPALLVALFGKATDKTRRKALKKTLHLLKTRGVPVPADLLPREEPALGKAAGGQATAFLSPIYGNGDCYLIFEIPKEVLGGNLLAAQFNDREGFRECNLFSLRRSEQGKFWAQFHGEVKEWFSPPPAFAVRLLEEAYARNPEAAAAAGYRYLREKVLRHWGEPALPPLEDLLPPVAEAEKNRLRERGMELALHPLFHSWLPGEEEIAPWYARLKEAQESPLVLTDQQKKVRSDAVLEEATRALHPPETLPLISRRLLLMAYFLELSGQSEQARIAQVAAEDLAAPERGALAGENPFLKGLVQFSLQLAWQQEKAQEQEPPSGLVTPPTDFIIRR